MHLIGSDVKFVITSFLDGMDALSLMSVNTTWQQLSKLERFCRLLYTHLFGECTERDMDIFEWNAETTWAFRLAVRCATMRNRRNGHVTNTIQIPFNDLHRETCLIDGSILYLDRFNDTRWFALRKHTEISEYRKRSMPASTQRPRGPHQVFKNPNVEIQVRGEEIVVVNTTTEKDVCVLGVIGEIAQVDCDPASDLVLISKDDGDDDSHLMSILDIRDGKRYPVSDAYGQLASHRSILHNGRLLVRYTDTFLNHVHLLDAKSGKVIAARLTGAGWWLVGMMPRHVVMRDADLDNQWRVRLLDAETLAETTVWDRARKPVMDLCGNELMIDQTFDQRRRQWTHVDVHGKKRVMDADFAPAQMKIMAFNCRWLLVADGTGNFVYDFMPPRTEPAQQGAKRFKTN